MTRNGTTIVREVQKNDLPALAEIEKRRWSREGTMILSLETLTAWYESQSPFFLVAEKEGVVTGFYYGILVHFSLDNIDAFTSEDARTNCGYTNHTHDPSAKSVYGINVVVVDKDAGVTLNAEVHKRVREMGAPYFVGFTRLVHLDRYLSEIEAHNWGKLPYPEEEIALWYSHQSMKMLGAKIWNECTKEPVLDLPPLRRPDTVLRFHVEGTNFGLLRIVSNYMNDQKSRNYGAFAASDWPHVGSQR